MKRILLSTFLLLLPFALAVISAQGTNGCAGEVLERNVSKWVLKDVGNSYVPVTYKSFTVNRLRSRVGMVWETTWECNNKGFEVQRKTGGGGWRKVAFVFSQAEGGHSNNMLTYEYTDVNTEKTESQYRLRQIDNDLQALISETRIIEGY